MGYVQQLQILQLQCCNCSKLGVGSVSDSEKCVFVIEGQHGEIADCTVQENGFNDAAVQKKQKGWFDGQ